MSTAANNQNAHHFLSNRNIPQNFLSLFQEAMKISPHLECVENILGFYKRRDDAAIVATMTLYAINNCIDESNAKKIMSEARLLAGVVRDMQYMLTTTRQHGWCQTHIRPNDIKGLYMEPAPTSENIDMYRRHYKSSKSVRAMVDPLVKIMRSEVPKATKKAIIEKMRGEMYFNSPQYQEAMAIMRRLANENPDMYGRRVSTAPEPVKPAPAPVKEETAPIAYVSTVLAEVKTQTAPEKPSKLDDMVGLDEPKNAINNIIRTHILNKIRTGITQNDQPMHMAFIGNPGTGKTETARYLAHILHEAGIIPENKMVERKANDLIGEYTGQTAPKVSAACAEASGGVLFIDETYIWAEVKYFGPEAATQLLQHMENDRGKFITILAGYPEDMDRLIKMNPGFKSRIPYIVDFPDYSLGDMAEIMKRMVGAKGLTMEPQALNIAMDYIKRRKEENPKDFANARDVRNTLQGMMDMQSERILSAAGNSITESIKLAKSFNQNVTISPKLKQYLQTITVADAEAFVQHSMRQSIRRSSSQHPDNAPT